MRRRDFFRWTGGAAAAAIGTAGVPPAMAGDAPVSLAAPAVITGVKDIRIAFTWPDNGKGQAASARRLVKRIESATGGRYRLHLVTGVGSGIGAVARGEADAYHGCEHDNLELDRAFAYFAGLPGWNGLRASSLDAWMLAGGGQELWDALSGNFGVKALLAGHTGRSIGLMGPQPMPSLADFAGRRVWTLGLARDVVRGIGAEPAILSASELGSALASGEVASAEGGGAVASQALGVLQPGYHVHEAAINRGGTALSLGFSRAVWGGMPAGDQAIIAAIANAELHAAIAEEKAQRQALLGPHAGRRLVKTTPTDLASSISRVSDAVVAHLAATDATTQRINESYVAFRRAIGIRTHTQAA